MKNWSYDLGNLNKGKFALTFEEKRWFQGHTIISALVMCIAFVPLVKSPF